MISLEQVKSVLNRQLGIQKFNRRLENYKKVQNNWEGKLTESLSEYKMKSGFRRCDIHTTESPQSTSV